MPLSLEVPPKVVGHPLVIFEKMELLGLKIGFRLFRCCFHGPQATVVRVGQQKEQ